MANNGKYGERLFQQIMSSRNYQVQDVSSNKQYWHKDIDFIVTSPTTGITKTFEVKWDNRIATTNNLYIEIANTHSKDGLSWFRFCEADYLAYGDARKRKFYIIPMDQLREIVEKMPKRYSQCGCDSAGYLVNISQIAEIIQEL